MGKNLLENLELFLRLTGLLQEFPPGQRFFFHSSSQPVVLSIILSTTLHFHFERAFHEATSVPWHVLIFRKQLLPNTSRPSSSRPEPAPLNGVKTLDSPALSWKIHFCQKLNPFGAWRALKFSEICSHFSEIGSHPCCSCCTDREN